ncbi:uncharacterized protein VP01_470g6 [Puccinia sorghi]|uniref:Inositol polyphosphate-related phosphatase domain-containing protein n=1 Tax=Puccinia sorghi TaxID=27349 RepID=A0A0L6UN09_9BASI|nr:uncharacterized protein VP01_470g6 [Puccinia sorghi]
MWQRRVRIGRSNCGTGPCRFVDTWGDIAREMRKRQTEYCTYRPIKALICSWNVDACKPSDLRGTCDNLNFLEDVLKSSFTPDQPTSASATHHSTDPPPSKQPSSSSNTSSKFPLNSRTPPTSTSTTARNAPDLIVFGFQEMIDLENKKLTASELLSCCTVLLGSRKKAAGNNSSGGIGSGSGVGNSEKLSDSVSQVYRKWHDKLVATVRTFMPPDDPYVVIHTENLVGLFTCVFVKSSERAKMRDIAVTTVKTGMKGRYGNKGAILARLVIDDSSICFINCHLAAGQKHVRQRNSDLIDILEEKSGFPDPPERPTTTSNTSHHQSSSGRSKNQKEMVEMSSGVYVGGGNGSSISDHEICFLQGDLNYRIDAQREDVIRAIAAGEYWKLLEFDQLSREKKLNPSCRLRAFNEPPIRFHPTYKYDPLVSLSLCLYIYIYMMEIENVVGDFFFPRGTHMYDSSEKARVPAWCDRILYRTAIEESSETEWSPGTIYIQQQQDERSGANPARPSTTTTTTTTTARPVNSLPVMTRMVESLDYRRYEVNISDHRPVSATFQILVKAFVPGLKRLVRDHALHKWSDHEAQIILDSRKYYSRL